MIIISLELFYTLLLGICISLLKLEKKKNKTTQIQKNYVMWSLLYLINIYIICYTYHVVTNIFIFNKRNPITKQIYFHFYFLLKQFKWMMTHLSYSPYFTIYWTTTIQKKLFLFDQLQILSTEVVTLTYIKKYIFLILFLIWQNA